MPGKSWFIAQRFASSKHFNHSLVRLGSLSIAISLAVNIAGLSILSGYKQEISQRFYGFHFDFTINDFESHATHQTRPIPADSLFLHRLEQIEGVHSVRKTTSIAGITRSTEGAEGIVFRGVEQTADLSFFQPFLLNGSLPRLSKTWLCDTVLISSYIAKAMNLELYQPIILYFLRDGTTSPLLRRFFVGGIYKTGISELDKILLLGDIKHVNRLAGFSSTQAGAIEVATENHRQDEALFVDLYETAALHNNKKPLNVEGLRELYPHVFNWLGILDTNFLIVLIVMLIVAAVNMSGAMLILVMGRISVIGLLQAIGISPLSLQILFQWQAFRLVLQGVFWGNLFGIGFCVWQQQTQFLSLNQETYMIDAIPIALNFFPILWVNLGTIVWTLLALWIPSMAASKLTTDKAIRFS